MKVWTLYVRSVHLKCENNSFSKLKLKEREKEKKMTGGDSKKEKSLPYPCLF